MATATRAKPAAAPAESRPQDPPCFRCGKPAASGARITRDGAEVTACRRCLWTLACEDYRAAQAAGTNGPIAAWRVVCEGCREWVAGVFHITLDRKRLCVRCAAAAGVREAKQLLQRQGGQPT